MNKLLYVISAAMISGTLAFGASAADSHLQKERSHRTVRTADRTVTTPPPVTKGFHKPQQRPAGMLVTPNLFKGYHALPDRGAKKSAAATTTTTVPQLNGCVIYNTTWTSAANNDGLYTVGNPTSTMLFPFNSISANGGGVEIDGVYYVTHYYDFWDMLFIDVAAYNIADGSEISIFIGENDNIAADITVDPTTGNVYAITFNSDITGYQLSRMTYTTDKVTSTAIAQLTGDWNALACDANGQLYAIRSEGVDFGGGYLVTSSSLCKIDKTTGSVTEIGETGQQPQYPSSATIDTATGRMYWNVCPPDGRGILCEVDLTTGVATELFAYTHNDQITGMYVNRASADEKAPAAVTDLRAVFPDGSLDGTLTFEVPAMTFDGTPAHGDLTFEILANDDKIDEGTTSFGSKVTRRVSLDSPGDYTFTVTVRNAAGRSPLAQTSLYVGHGVPSRPTATLSYANGTMSLRWSAVKTTVDGGYIDPAEVTYSVTRFPGNVTVASYIPETTFSETIEAPRALTDYYYQIVAHNGLSTSAVAKSNIITLGSIIPPYSNTFDLPSSTAGFTIIDGNKDDKSWEYNDHTMRVSYNTARAMDDWLVTPSFYLEAGKSYTVSFSAWAYDPSYPERVEAKWGNGATVDALDKVLVNPTVVNVRLTAPLKLTGYITPETDGIYYIGIHGISDADRFYLNIDDLTVSAGTPTTIPGVATDLTVTAATDGSNSATISFRAPATDITGNPLNNLTRVDVTRSDELVKRFDNPTPGESLSFDDTVNTPGMYTYTVQGFNDAGEGRPTSVSAFVGVDAPSTPLNVTITETSDPGVVTVSWDAVVTGERGNPINPALVSYYVARNNGLWWDPITEKSNSTSVTFRAVAEGEQEFVQFAVFAETLGGSSVALTPVIAAGTPYGTIAESFPDGIPTYPWSVGFTEKSGEWGVYDDPSFEDFTSQDADNGYAAMEASEYGSTSGLISAKFRLENMTTPAIGFHTFNIVGSNGAPDINDLDVYITEAGSDDWTLLSHNVIHQLGDGKRGWQSVIVPLNGYTGKTLQVRFQATANEYVYTLIDNIFIGNIPALDVAVRSISAPANVMCGDSYQINVLTYNAGTSAASDITVTLYAGNSAVDTKVLADLASGATETVTFDRTMSALADTPIDYHATVTMNVDENTDNNVSSTITVTPMQSNLPAATGLTGKVTAEGIELKWDEPDLDSLPAAEGTTDFEDGESFAHEYAGWTFVDGDMVAVGGFQGTGIPGITTGETTASFFVFDAGLNPFNTNETFDAYSGTKYLASLFRYDDGVTDDWAISPELDGIPQTITFVARSYSSAYPEKIETYYSTGSTDPADFIKTGPTIDPVAEAWTRYSFTIPAGARRFAVRSCAKGGFMLMLDDFTFASQGNVGEISLKGYDVYRDGELLNSTPCAETTFTDTTLSLGQHSYTVVTVYDSGISAPSQPFELNYSSVETTGTDKITVTTGHGTVTVTGAEGLTVNIIAADGKTVHSSVAPETLTVKLVPGLYIVTTTGVRHKAVIK